MILSLESVTLKPILLKSVLRSFLYKVGKFSLSLVSDKSKFSLFPNFETNDCADESHIPEFVTKTYKLICFFE